MDKYLSCLPHLAVKTPHIFINQAHHNNCNITHVTPSCSSAYLDCFNFLLTWYCWLSCLSFLWRFYHQGICVLLLGLASCLSALWDSQPSYCHHLSMSLGFNKSWKTQAFCFIVWMYLCVRGQRRRTFTLSGLCLASELFIIALTLDKQHLLKSTTPLSMLMYSINKMYKFKDMTWEPLW